MAGGAVGAGLGAPRAVGRLDPGVRLATTLMVALRRCVFSFAVSPSMEGMLCLSSPQSFIYRVPEEFVVFKKLRLREVNEHVLKSE